METLLKLLQPIEPLPSVLASLVLEGALHTAEREVANPLFHTGGLPAGCDGTMVAQSMWHEPTNV